MTPGEGFIAQNVAAGALADSPADPTSRNLTDRDTARSGFRLFPDTLGGWSLYPPNRSPTKRSARPASTAAACEIEVCQGVLIIDDNPDDAELTIRALKGLNPVDHLVWIKDGAQALDFLFHQGAYADHVGCG
jgi:hypothetical protein